MESDYDNDDRDDDDHNKNNEDDNIQTKTHFVQQP